MPDTARLAYVAIVRIALPALAFVASLLTYDTAPAAEGSLDISPHFQPPQKYVGDFGPYRSPLVFDDGTKVDSPADWPRRCTEIEAQWRKIIGPLPARIAKPKVTMLERRERDGFIEQHLHLEVGPDGRMVDGFLLLPPGRGPFPAVITPFYEPQSSIGLGKPDALGSIDFSLQLVRRGFVALSIGTPGSLEKPGANVRELLVDVGDRLQAQPLGYLALVASNCLTALTQIPEVDAKRIGIVGHSYGGKWSMFASCLDDRFAAACWCDPGIVFNEANASINYWEPWYLGWIPGTQRKPGVPTADNSRTGPYAELFAHDSREMIELHALMAGRPVLVSGGSEDPEQNWRALNHLIAVNKLLGHENLVGMTTRPKHRPRPEDAAVIYAFFEQRLKTKD